ncbi:MAG: hypothetical protein AAF267_04640 [Deinococcota bacterium]
MPTCLRVLLPLPLPAFDFLPPFDLREQVSNAPESYLGYRLVVPWQQGVRVGIVVGTRELKASGALELREGVSFLDAEPFVTPNAVQLIDALAEHSLTPAGLVLRDLLPVGLSVNLQHDVRLVEGATLGVSSHAELTTDWQPSETINPSELDFLRRQGVLLERASIIPDTVQQLVPRKPADDALDGKSKANQRRALDYLLDTRAMDSAAALSRAVNVPASAVRALITKGYARYEDALAPPAPLPEYPPEPLGTPPVFEPSPSGPPPSQDELLTASVVSVSGGLRRERLAALLPALTHWIGQGRSVLVLVPEHARLHETARALTAHVPLLTLNGELSEKQRSHVWTRVQQGMSVVLVGSYLALLAPLKDVAAVVVLEEGSSSYKLLAGSRLSVPTAAQMLADLYDCPLWLTDALIRPSTALQTGQYTLTSSDGAVKHLQHQAKALAATLPQPKARVHVINLAEAHNYPLTADLIRVLKQVAERHRQAILLAPRKGFSAALRCGACGHVVTASHCDCALPLRYHRRGQVLRCHQCQFEQPIPTFCPNCQSDALQPARAAGTEWIAEQLRTAIPNLQVRRLDSDSKDDLNLLYDGKPGVLVATTAIFRQTPLPNVSLIALTLLDTLFSTADFRSDEVAYRALLNLPELAPGKRPLTIVQTFQPEHPALRAWLAAEQTQADDIGPDSSPDFNRALLDRRARYRYPPFSVLCKVQISDRKAPSAAQAAAFLADAIRVAGAAEADLIGPMAAPVAHARGYYHQHLLIRADSSAHMLTYLQPVRDYRGSSKLRWDVEPWDVGGLLD